MYMYKYMKKGQISGEKLYNFKTITDFWFKFVCDNVDTDYQKLVRFQVCIF